MKKMTSPFLLAGCLLLGLTACFSPWAGDETELRISLGNQGLSRQLVGITGTPPDYESFTYELILKGPGGTQRFDFNGTSAVVKVVPGNYQVTVRALGNSDAVNAGGGPNPFPAGTMILRAFGEQDVTVRGGAAIPVSIDMTSAMEVTNWEQLGVACSLDANSTRKEFIFIKNSFSTTVGAAISIDRNITLRAERPVSITAGAPNECFSVVGPNGTLTLEGPLTLAGGPGITHTSAAVQIDGGTFTMTGGSITGFTFFVPLGVNAAPAVYVSSGTFNMSGGSITGNTKTDNGNSNAGGVYVSAGGTFNMSGGIITGNNFSNIGSGAGGVYVAGTFNMSGGIITGNSRTNTNPGGVLVYGGTLNIVSPATPDASGSIRGNISPNSPSNVFNYTGTVRVNGVPLLPPESSW
jgi:hypothetical protein